jgi:hypothetical protein
MLIPLAAFLAMGWIVAFFILDVNTIAIHTLVLGAALSVLVHFIHIRRVGGRPDARP